VIRNIPEGYRTLGLDELVLAGDRIRKERTPDSEWLEVPESFVGKEVGALAVRQILPIVRKEPEDLLQGPVEKDEPRLEYDLSKLGFAPGPSAKTRRSVGKSWLTRRTPEQVEALWPKGHTVYQIEAWFEIDAANTIDQVVPILQRVLYGDEDFSHPQSMAGRFEVVDRSDAHGVCYRVRFLRDVHDDCELVEPSLLAGCDFDHTLVRQLLDEINGALAEPKAEAAKAGVKLLTFAKAWGNLVLFVPPWADHVSIPRSATGVVYPEEIPAGLKFAQVKETGRWSSKEPNQVAKSWSPDDDPPAVVMQQIADSLQQAVESLTRFVSPAMPRVRPSEIAATLSDLQKRSAAMAKLMEERAKLVPTTYRSPSTFFYAEYAARRASELSAGVNDPKISPIVAANLAGQRQAYADMLERMRPKVATLEELLKDFREARERNKDVPRHDCVPYRELGPDEITQKGDQFSTSADGGFQLIFPDYVGRKVRETLFYKVIRNVEPPAIPEDEQQREDVRSAVQAQLKELAAIFGPSPEIDPNILGGKSPAEAKTPASELVSRERLQRSVARRNAVPVTYLGPADRIEAGDVALFPGEEPRPVAPGVIGRTTTEAGYPQVGRPVAKADFRPKAPPEGHRILQLGDCLRGSDRFWDLEQQAWVEMPGHLVGVLVKDVVNDIAGYLPAVRKEGE
jgi:hypothetical protein